MKLEGLKVLDLSQFLPGPHLTMMMADHGAEVIRIEMPAGEPTRGLGAWQDGSTVWFNNTHRGKKSVVLDLKQPEAVQAFLALASQADVLVEAFRPGVTDRLGIGWNAVSAVNPRIVYCSITAYGQSGPLSTRVAHDLSVEAESGVLDLNRGRDGAAAMPCIPSSDMAGSLTAMSGILMALLRREKTGHGDYLDISMQDSLLSWTVNVISPVFAERRDLDPSTERSLGGAAFYGIYRCADGGELTLGGSEIKFAANLLNALGRPDLIPLCELKPGRGQDRVREFLTGTFASRPLAHWEAVLAKLDVCWAPVRKLVDAFDQPHVTARGMKLQLGEQTHLGIPIQFREEPGRVVPGAPKLGEHTRQVLLDAGVEQEVVERLAKRG